MSSSDPWVGTWRPHKPRGPVAAQNKGPGPKYALPGLTGCTNHDPTKYKTPAYSMRRRHKSPSTDCSPGPQYLIPPNITTQGKMHTPAAILTGRPEEKKPAETPGPAKYCIEGANQLVFPSTPAFSLSGKHQEGSQSQTPGPSVYTQPPVMGPNIAVKPGTPAYSFSGRHQRGSFLADLTKTPGPAAYGTTNLNVTKKKAAQYSMGGRNYPEFGFQIPGPGAYHPEKVNLTKQQVPSFTFGIHHSQYLLQSK